MKLTENKIKHSKAVAEYMYDNASRYDVSPSTAYFLGLNHDIGYIYGPNNHGSIGSSLLFSIGVCPAIVNAVRFHGTDPDVVINQIGYIDEYLHLLYEADMSISPTGEMIGFSERLKDIKARYGSDSSQYVTALKIVTWLKNHSR